MSNGESLARVYTLHKTLFRHNFAAESGFPHVFLQKTCSETMFYEVCRPKHALETRLNMINFLRFFYKYDPISR